MTTVPFSHWWFQGKSVQALFHKLYLAGPNARLEVYMTEDAGLALRVKGPDGAKVLDDDDPINESHRCPPSC